jgi:LysM repeat protein
MVPPDYQLHVPKGTGNQLMVGLELIPPEHRDAWRMHRLGAGETLADLGKRYGVALNSLVAANNLPSPEANEGDRLIVPAAVRAEPAARRPASQATVRRTSASTAAKGKAPAARPKANSRPKPKTALKTPVIVARTTAQ